MKKYNYLKAFWWTGLLRSRVRNRNLVKFTRSCYLTEVENVIVISTSPSHLQVKYFLGSMPPDHLNTISSVF